MAKRSSNANKRNQFNSQRQTRRKKQRIKQMIILGLVLIGVLAAAGWGIQGYIALINKGKYREALAKHRRVCAYHGARPY